MWLRRKWERFLARLRGELTWGGAPTLKGWGKQGVKIGQNCHILPKVHFDSSHCWHIEIGDNVTLAPEVYILAHDASTKRPLGYTRIGKVRIEDNVFVGARALILPGVTIGQNAIVGAGSVVTQDVPPNVVVAGNPARVLMTIEDFLAKQQEGMTRLPCFDARYTLAGGITPEMKAEMNRQMVQGKGYVI